jgi:transposase
MRDNDGRKLDHKTLEALRYRAIEAVQNGEHPEDVAATLGMARGTLYMWLAKFREGGKKALAAKPVPGRPRKLSAAQMQQVYRWVSGGDPRQYQFEFALWTRELVAVLIRRNFGVSLSLVSVGRLLKVLGLSVQRPLWRAWQQDLQAVDRWKREEFPAIKAEAAKVGATIYFADEAAGLRSDYHAGTTWGVRGQTPIVKTTGARHSLNMVSAVTTRGTLRFSCYQGKFTADPPHHDPSHHVRRSGDHRPDGTGPPRCAQLLGPAQPHRGNDHCPHPPTGLPPRPPDGSTHITRLRRCQL